MSASSSLTEYLAAQDDLVHEAALALPHSFTHCTYNLGSIRQAVSLCLTCGEQRGICSACSIACHTDHEQVELFPKRNFRCDCPTTALAHPCSLHKTLERGNDSNQYGHNFQGVFCCGRPYDPSTERETMIQCLACEDWFHESCLNLRERPSSREPTPIDTPLQLIERNDTASPDGDDGASDASSSGLPPPLISASDYESFICGACVSGISTLKRWAGTQGILMVVRDDASAPWKVVGYDSQFETVRSSPSIKTGLEPSSTAGSKRPLSPSAIDPSGAKRIRASIVSSSNCIAPHSHPNAQKTVQLRFGNNDCSLGTGDIFLSDGWRERWCRCNDCIPSLEAHPYLLEEEETYEPPKDPDSGLSLEELGMRALHNLPRDRAIDGIHAFNAMRDDLVKFLRPFAQEGKIVNEEDVRSFFDSLKEASIKSGKGI